MGGRNTEIKFWAKVEKGNSCWTWTGSNSNNYGVFSIQNTYRRATHLAYIFTYQLPIDTKLYLCHTCDNPICVNPEHLYEGNPKTNAQDRMARGRSKGLFTKDTPTTFKKGNECGKRKLSVSLATPIKKDLKTMRQCDVIRKYNVNRDAVRNIKREITWASLEV